MKINFTKAEYKSLIELLYMGDWMASAFTDNKDDEPKQYTDLIQKIYSVAKQMGHEDDIEYAKEHDEYFPTQYFETQSGVQDYIDGYDKKSFWDSFIHNMTDRDVCNKYQINSISELPIEKRFKALDEMEPIWIKEFAKHGIKRLNIVKK